MAAYQAKLSEVEAKGVRFIALSVDQPEIAEAFRDELGLDFTILCDTEREVVKAWDRFNRWEMGGIAKPAMFVIDSDMRVRLASLDSAAKRYSVDDLIEFLNSDSEMARLDQPLRTFIIPNPVRLLLQPLRMLRNKLRTRRATRRSS